MKSLFKGFILSGIFLAFIFTGCRRSAQTGLPIEMILVDGGKYEVIWKDLFRNKELEKLGYSGSWPAFRVMVSSFYLGEYEVTQEQYEAVMGTNPSRFKFPDHPVENVSWNDAVRFCNKLSEKEGLNQVYNISNNIVTADFTKNGYRLPTEAEWEFSASGGKKTKNYLFIGGDKVEDIGWFVDNAGSSSMPIGKKRPNELGMYDMGGNVWEWCWDYLGVYSENLEQDYKGPVNGYLHILKGGGWTSQSLYLIRFRRYGERAETKLDHAGFRIARNAK